MASKVRFDDIEKEISTTRKVVQESAAKSADVDSRLQKILAGAQLREVAIDTADNDFEAVIKNNEAAQANIAALIYGLDEITQAFGKEFSAMAQPTFGEKVMGFLSKRKSEEMRSERVKNADIQDNLNELIRKSDVISTMLTEQLAVIKDRLEKTAEGHGKVNTRMIEVAREIEAKSKRLDEVGIQHGELTARVADLTGEELKIAEKELAEVTAEYNRLQSERQEMTAIQQSLERYAAQYKNYVESLQKQAAAQSTLIGKLKVDTEQRTIMYDALVQSIRTAEQQNIAHRIDDVGRETDAQADAMITQIGISAENRIVGMMESHETFMKRTAEVRAKGQVANAEFARRFEGILNKVDSGKYVEG